MERGARTSGRCTHHWDKSIVGSSQVGTKSGIASCLNNIGMVQRDLHNYKKSLEYYPKALELRKEIGNKADSAASYNNIAGVIQYLDGLEKAFLGWKGAQVQADDILVAGIAF
jgi:hypothetical protein